METQTTETEVTEKVAQKIDSLEAAMQSAARNNPGVSVKESKAGRKKGSQNRSKTPTSSKDPIPLTTDYSADPKTVKALEKVFRGLGGAASKAFDVTPLEDEEVSTLAEGWGMLVEQYMEKFGEHTPWIAAAGSTLVVAGPRVMEYMEKRTSKVPKETKDSGPIISPTF